MLVRLAPLRPQVDDAVEMTAARRRRRRRIATAAGAPLLLLLIGGGLTAAVLTGTATEGEASMLAGVLSVGGLAELLRRRLAHPTGTGAAPAAPTHPVAERLDAEPEHEPERLDVEPETAEPEPFTGVWSARGAIRRDARRVPPTRCAVPPAPTTTPLQPSPAEHMRAHAPGPEADEPVPPVAAAHDLDLTREVLAALHAGSEA